MAVLNVRQVVLESINSDTVSEDIGTITQAISHGAAHGAALSVIGIAGGVAAAKAHQFVSDKLKEHKTNRMFKNTFHSGAKVTLNGTQGKKEGSIVSHDKESGKYHVRWHDGTTSSHHAGNDSRDKEPQIMPKEWKH